MAPIRVPESVIRTQPYGAITVFAQIVSAATGNASNTLPVTVQWAWDLPLALPANSQYGFVIDGASAGDLSSHRVRGAGDVNGDGYTDLVITAPTFDTAGASNTGAVYVVFGKPDLQRINLQTLSAGTSSQGFMIRGAAANSWLAYSADGNLDVNGDGLSDLVLTNTSYTPLDADLFSTPLSPGNSRAYIVYGRTATSTVELSSLTPSQGYSLQILDGVTAVAFNSSAPLTTAPGELQEIGRAGDLNADGFDDFLVSRVQDFYTDSVSRGAYVLYGTSEQRSSVVLSKNSVPPNAGFYIQGADATSQFGSMFSGNGDLNGDGYDDLVMSMAGDRHIAVVYGGATRTQTLPISQVSQAATSTGFLITGHSSLNPFIRANEAFTNTLKVP